jgi:ribosome-associated toxin RatA of RatAB toxin-antitoxin module
VSTIREDGPSGRIAGTGATRGAVAVALIATMGWAHAAAAVTISITAERHGEIIEIHASALLKAEAATAWRVLTDYGRYPEFIPDLRVSRVVARRGPTVTVDQAGDARLWLLRMPLEITFEITESPPYGVRSRAVAGSLRALESRYVLTPASTGVHLEYTGRIAPGFELFGRVEQYAVQQNVARQFKALADEIERSSAPGR